MDEPASDEYAIGWICALPCELAAARAVLQRHYRPPATDHPELTDGYEYGAIGSNNIVIVQLQSGVYGTTSAARVVTRLRQCFPSIEYGLMVGIGGGVPTLHDIRLGDVVVGHPTPGFPGVWQYDFGKMLEDGEYSDTGVLNKPPDIFLTAISKLGSKLVPVGKGSIEGSIREALEDGYLSEKFASPGPGNDRLFMADYKHRDPSASCDQCDPDRVIKRPARRRHFPLIHYGLIASGNSVIKSGVKRDQISGDRNVLCFEMEAAGIVDELPSLVIRGICDYSDSHKNKIWQPYAALAAAAYAKELLIEIPRIEPRRNLKGQEFQCIRDLGGSNPEDDKNRIENSKDQLIEQSCSWILSNPYFRMWLPLRESDASMPVLWIEGGPGKGKTMIMMSIVNRLEETFARSNTTAISYFFCQATDGRLNNTTAILKGLIHQLLAHNKHRMLIKHLKKEFDTSGPDAFTGANAHYALRRVFLNMIADEAISRFYFLVDALDECTKDLGYLLQFINLTVSKSDKTRWFVTSRPNIDIRAELGDQYYLRRISLEDHPEYTTGAINIYIKHKVNELSRKKHYNPGLRAEITSTLQERAQNTFLWVHLVCKELSKARASNALRILAKVPNGLDALYKQTFRRLLKPGDDDDDDDALLYSRVLAASLVAVRPLRLYELILFAEISDDMNEEQLEDLIVERCELFLLVQNGTVAFVHQSAKDFLDNQVGRESFMLWGKGVEHRNMTRICFELLSRELKMDICGLKSPGLDVAGLDPEFQRPLRLLEYACFYWIHHSTSAMAQSGNDQFDDNGIRDEDRVLNFLRKHFLHWVEAVAIMGVFPQLIPLISNLEAAVKNHESLSAFLYDARRFILYFHESISRTPLQLYSSALALAPENSIVKRTFLHLMPKWIRKSYNVAENWGTTLQVIRSRNEVITTLAMSPDDQQLAEGTCEGVITLWDARTGTAQEDLKGHAKGVTSLSFSPDGCRLASGSSDETVRIWNTSSGELEHTLRPFKGEIRIVAFLPDSKQLVFKAEWDAIQLWDGRPNGRILEIASHTRQVIVRSLAVSPDGKNIVFGAAVKKGNSSRPDRNLLLTDIEMWEIPSNIKRGTLGGKYIREQKRPMSHSIAFSPDGRKVAIAIENATSIIVEDLVSGRIVEMIGSGQVSIEPFLRFSRDGERLVSESNHRELHIWDVASGSMVQSFKNAPCGHRMLIASDLRHGASFDFGGYHEYFIRTFDLSPMSSPDLERPEIQVSRCPRYSTFSPDGTKLAWEASLDAISRESCFVLLDISKDSKPALSITALQMNDRAYAITFSPDSKFLMVAGTSGSIGLWDATSKSQLTHSSCFGREFNEMNVCRVADGRLATVSDEKLVLWDILTIPSADTRGVLQPQVVCKEFHLPGLPSASREAWRRARTFGKRVESPVCRIALPPDASVLAVGMFNGCIELWSISSGKMIYRIPNTHEEDRQTPMVFELAFSPDGEQLVAWWWWYNKLKLFHTRTGSEMRPRILGTLEANAGDSSISEDFRFLETPKGLIDLSTGEFTMKIDRSSWVLYRGKPIFALPADRFGCPFLVRNNVVAIRDLRGTWLILDMAVLASEMGCEEEQSFSPHESESESDFEYLDSPRAYSPFNA
ncbi:hypothetical protein TWF696_008389 [Orbilia brochopaga]|uniref:NACHT domain-containing protein n=1 Tax=Orbilia brochopaga TaxID=3140254 RepID=A0AAV9UK96_9PEZI